MTQNQCRPATKNSPPQTMVISIVCPKSGCMMSGMMVAGRSSMASSAPGMSRRRAPSVKAQADSTTKAGFTNSDGWSPMPPIEIQRCAPLISGPKCSARITSTMLTGIEPQRQPPDVAQGQERDEQHHGDGRNEIENLPADEMKGAEAQALGHRRAPRHQEDEARHHENGERGQGRAIDRPPPIADQRTFRAGHHGVDSGRQLFRAGEIRGEFARNPVYGPLTTPPGSERTRSRKRLPRISKS
jgi:hypothetical protein